MTSKELMIGDWVLSPFNKPIKIDPYKWVLDAQKEGNEVVGFRFDALSPISLTEEILNANFALRYKSEFRKEYEHDDENGYVDITIRPSHIHLYIMVGSESTNLHMNIQHVHELQHALRLCGFNNIADNFKV